MEPHERGVAAERVREPEKRVVGPYGVAVDDEPRGIRIVAGMLRTIGVREHVGFGLKRELRNCPRSVREAVLNDAAQVAVFEVVVERHPAAEPPNLFQLLRPRSVMDKG